MQPLVVIVADSAPLFRSSLRTVLGREGAIVREACSFAELHALAQIGGDVALVALDLPPLGGLAALSALAEVGGPPCVIWGLEPTGAEILAAVEAGAAAVVRKDTATARLVQTLYSAATGTTVLDPDLASPLAQALRRRAAHERARHRASGLTARERTVLEFAASGRRNREIATTLGLSEFTVKRHIQNILRKLDVPTRQAAGVVYLLAKDEIGPRCAT